MGNAWQVLKVVIACHPSALWFTRVKTFVAWGSPSASGSRDGGVGGAAVTVGVPWVAMGRAEDVGPCANLPPKHRTTPRCGRAAFERLPSVGSKNYFPGSFPGVPCASCWAASREFAPWSLKTYFYSEWKETKVFWGLFFSFLTKVTDSSLRLQKLCRDYSSAGSTLWFGQELLVCTERLILLMAAWSTLDRQFGRKFTWFLNVH